MTVSKILVVDDDRFARTFCHQILEEDGGFEVVEAQSVDDGLEIIRQGGIDLVISDLVMPDKTGLDLVEILRLEHPYLGVILITGHGTVETAVKAMKIGALDYIRKPLNPAEFKIVVHRALEQSKLAEENRELRNSLKLYDASSRISRTIEIEELYQIIFDLIIKETGATRGFLYIVDQEQGESNIILSEGFDVQENEGLDRKLFDEFQQELAHLSEPFIPDHPLTTTVKYRSSSDPVQSSLFIPLQNKNELAGVVVLFDTEKKGVFGKESLRVSNFLCQHASTALENAMLYSQAKILTITDDLTNVFNYRYLNNILDRELVRAQRLSSSMSVLFLDLDSFKEVNDQHGHLLGSKILVELAGLLKGAVRKVDAVARYGGDEYIVVLTDTNSKGAVIVAERIRQMVEDYIFTESEGYPIKLTVSIGVASYPEHGVTKVELLHLADEAMYKGKFGRKNIVYVATPGEQTLTGPIDPPISSDTA
ncbi:MAG: diguanylate cyclase [bacterium]|nr:diguanylate cyclase [bacterium]MDT8366063.1 diguanylate cyclase [bacterium]